MSTNLQCICNDVTITDCYIGLLCMAAILTEMIIQHIYINFKVYNQVKHREMNKIVCSKL